MTVEILNAPFVQDAMETCHYFWKAGWSENHAGNLTYLLSKEEEEKYRLKGKAARYLPMNFLAESLANRCFLVTRTGAFFKNVLKYPERDLGLVRVCTDGKGIELLWGFSEDGHPTSEFPAHLLCHQARLKQDVENRVVLHCHPTYTTGMTFKQEFDEKSFTRTMWSLNSECILVFPEGLGMLPWMVCGEGDIGQRTAEKMEIYRLVVWPYHGVFACGNSLDKAVGLIETVEKNAHVYMMNNGSIHQGITLEQLKCLAEAFHLHPNEKMLDI